jgi:hypothetical protein
MTLLHGHLRIYPGQSLRKQSGLKPCVEEIRRNAILIGKWGHCFIVFGG